MVFAGSCRQYDWSEAALAPDGLARERTTRRAPSTRYGRAKETTTRELGAIATKTGLAVATGLVFFPFGPYEKLERLVPSVTRRLLAGKVAETTLGTQVRDFIHVDDCAGALAALVDSEATGPFNIGSGIGTRVGDVSTMIARILAREDLLRPGALPMRDDEPAHLVADVTRMRDEVGFTPAFDLEAGLRDAIDWWRARPDQALQK
jgi:nucleoside-diphosphate-sugar epimerase